MTVHFRAHEVAIFFCNHFFLFFLIRRIVCVRSEKCFPIMDDWNQHFYCNYTFHIDLSPIRITFGAKSIEKVTITIQIWIKLNRFRKDLFECKTLTSNWILQILANTFLQRLTQKIDAIPQTLIAQFWSHNTLRNFPRNSLQQPLEGANRMPSWVFGCLWLVFANGYCKQLRRELFHNHCGFSRTSQRKS